MTYKTPHRAQRKNTDNMNLLKDQKRLQIANVLEIGKEIPSSVRPKDPAWSHKLTV